MALINNPVENTVRERYQKILNNEGNQGEDCALFLSDCFGELRKKILLINPRSKIALLTGAMPMLFGIILIIIGISVYYSEYNQSSGSADFDNFASSSAKEFMGIMCGFGAILFLSGLIALFVFAIKWKRMKKAAADLRKYKTNVDNWQTLMLDLNNMDKIVKIFASAARFNTYAYQNSYYGGVWGFNRSRNNGPMWNNYSQPLGNPETQQLTEAINIIDIIEEIDWEKLIKIYNSYARTKYPSRN